MIAISTEHVIQVWGTHVWGLTIPPCANLEKISGKFIDFNLFYYYNNAQILTDS